MIRILEMTFATSRRRRLSTSQSCYGSCGLLKFSLEQHNCLADVLRTAFIVYTMVLHIWHACQALLTSVILIAPLQCHSAAQIMGTVHSTQVTIKATSATSAGLSSTTRYQQPVHAAQLL
jgi:hypothetical protein